MVDIGSLYRTTYDVYDATGTLVDPTAVEVHIFKPDATEFTPPPTISPVGSPTGRFKYDYLTTEVGRHTGYWRSTAPTTTRGFTFEVTPLITEALLSLPDVKRHLNKDLTSTTDDDELAILIRVATEIVESKVGAVVRETVVERHSGGNRSLWLREAPVIEVVSIEPWLTSGTPVAAVSVQLDPGTGRVERLDGQGFYDGPYKVTYVAGREVVEATITQGAREVVRHLWETQRGDMVVGARGGGPGFEAGEDEMFTVSGREYTVPRRVLELLAPHPTMPGVG